MRNQTDSRYDFIIVGSGGGGMCAALAAHEMGLRALIVEKSDKVGGTTALSGGALWIPNNPVILRRGVPDTYEQAKTYLDACCGNDEPASSQKRRHAFLTEGPRMVAFLEKIGMKFTHAEGWACYHHLEKPGAMARGRSIQGAIFDLNELGPNKDTLLQRPVKLPPVLTSEAYKAAIGPTNWLSRWTMLKAGVRMIRNRFGSDLAGMGLALQGRMYKLLLDRKIPIWTKTTPTAFITENGRVTGVELMREGAPISVTASRGILIASGGFSRNLEMREKYQPKPTSSGWAHGCAGDTGEMIEMGRSLGAEIGLMDEAVWTLSSVLPNGVAIMHPGDMTHPHCILVDSQGERYANESGSYVTIGQAMYRRHREVSAVPSWFVLDSQFLRKYRWAGQLPGRQPIEDWVKSGYMVRGQSLDDLATQCGMNVSRFKSQIERFNDYCKTGVDKEFNRGASAHNQFSGDPSVKPNPNLGALSEGPFFAVKAWPGDVGTTGGILADEFARALRSDGSVIPGLYATGNASASPMGRVYPGAGASIGPSFAFGYIAACHAAQSG